MHGSTYTLLPPFSVYAFATLVAFAAPVSADEEILVPVETFVPRHYDYGAGCILHAVRARIVHSKLIIGCQ